MKPDIAFEFLMAFDTSYRTMAASLIRSLNVLHPGHFVRILTTTSEVELLHEWVQNERLRDTKVFEFHSHAQLNHGEWHELIWAKLEAFAQDPSTMQIVLDVDQMLYRNFNECVQEAHDSGKVISASSDVGSWADHFHEIPDRVFDADKSPAPQCFNAGAMIVRPSRKTYEAVHELALAKHVAARLPEQAILNLWAYENEQYHNLGDKFMLQPWSPRVLERPVPSCLIHFWTPRPGFFGPSPVRTGEPTLEELISEFQRINGRPYPLKRFAADYEMRCDSTLAEGLAP